MHINSIHEICLIKCSPADVERMGVESTGVNVGSSGLKPPNVGGSQLIFHVQAQMCADSYLIDVPSRKLGAISLFTVHPPSKRLKRVRVRNVFLVGYHLQ